MDTEKKNFEKLYGDLINSDWFKKAYSAGDCPFNIPEAEESKDERIRQELLGVIKHFYDGSVLRADDYKKYSAYLEKQKERKPIDIDFVSDWLKKHVREYVNSEYNEFHKTVEYDGSISIERLIEDLKKAIEQQSLANENDFARRPTELSEEDILHLNNAILAAEKEWGINSNTAKWLRSFFLPKKTKTIEDAKPEDILAADKNRTKWSKEDDAIHTRVLGALGKAFMGVLPTKPSQEDIEWFKSLPERFNLQPKQEWSEEDDKMLKSIIEDSQNCHILGVDQIDWIKSLRPQWKPNKKQMEALDRCVEYLDESDNEDADVMNSLSVDLKNCFGL